MPSDPSQYQPLANYLTPPLWGLITVLLLAMGLIFWAQWLNTQFFKQKTALTLCGSGLFSVGAITAIIHWAALVDGLLVFVTLVVGVGLMGTGAWQLFSWSRFGLGIQPPRKNGQTAIHPTLNLAGWVIAAVTLLALFLAALGPATDRDSLDYHLGVPLDWINHNGATVRADWLHAPLVGLGEMVNLLGLRMGIDSLGAMVQWLSLICIVVAVQALAHSDYANNRLLAILLTVGMPVVVFLTPNQKPQLLGAAALTVAMAYVFVDWNSFGRNHLIIIFGCVGLAMGSKYPALLTGGLVVLATYRRAVKMRQLPTAILLSTLLVGGFAGSVWLRNWLFYGDPLAPFLSADVVSVAFAEHLDRFGGQKNFANLVRLPLSLMLTTNLGQVTELLGLGVLAIVFGWRGKRELLFWTLAAYLLLIIFGQWTPRFFLEPYLWAVMLAVSTPWGQLKTWFTGLLFVQAVGVMGMALLAAWTLFPGALNASLREATLQRVADGYQLSQWLDEELPDDARIFVESRTAAHFPRPFVSYDVARYWYLVDLPEEERLMAFGDYFGRIIAQNEITHMVLFEDITRIPYRLLGDCVSEIIAGPQTFPVAKRNPFNRDENGPTFVIVELQSVGCR